MAGTLRLRRQQTEWLTSWLAAMLTTGMPREGFMNSVTSQDAEDLIQETFLQLFDTIGQCEERSKFETWLDRRAVNEANRFLCKGRRRWICALVSEPLSHSEQE